MSNIFCKMLNKKVAIATLTASIFGAGLYVAAPQPAHAIYCSNCATFYQQMHEYAEAVSTQINTAQQLATQIQQYQNMVVQGTGLPSSMFGSITSDLGKIMRVYQSTQSLGRNISNMENAFKVQFPGYQTYLTNLGRASQNMPDKYGDWSKQGLDNARTAMQAAGMNTSTFATEDAQLAQIVNRSQNAAGRMQAIQAGNEIAAANVQQLQKLRDLLSTQIQLQGNYMAQEQERQSIDDANRQQRRSANLNNTGTNKEY